MKLTLDREDLMPEYANVNCSQTKFEHFKPDVQAAICAVGRATFFEYDRSSYNSIRLTDAFQHNKLIPPEILDLLRFMCDTWAEIDKFVYQHCDIEVFGKYPVIQGTANQMRLKQIGKQPYNKSNLRKAVDWMIKQHSAETAMCKLMQNTEDIPAEFSKILNDDFGEIIS